MAFSASRGYVLVLRTHEKPQAQSNGERWRMDFPSFQAELRRIGGTVQAFAVSVRRYGCSMQGSKFTSDLASFCGLALTSIAQSA